MKNILFEILFPNVRLGGTALATVLCLTLCPDVAQTEADGGSEPQRIHLLTIGNSFAENPMTYLKAITASVPGREVVISKANLGGTSLEEHATHLENSERVPEYKPYKGKSLRDILEADTYDVVTIQQHSQLSWKEESYQPHANRLIDFVRQVAPDAEIRIQQTWAYHPDCPRLGKWKLTREEMHRRLTAAYAKLGEEKGLDIIPTGDAFHLSFEGRNELDLWHPEDRYHAGEAGKYLGGLVWFGALFATSPEAVTFRPRGMDAETADYLRGVAADVLDDKGDSPGGIDIHFRNAAALFEPDEPVCFTVAYESTQQGTAEVVAVVRDDSGEGVLSRSMRFDPPAGAVEHEIDLGLLPEGYFTVDLFATLKWDGKIHSGQAGGRIVVSNMEHPELHWTTVELADEDSIFEGDRPVSLVVNVEREGDAADDSGLPDEASYKAWLRERLQSVPADRAVFQVWSDAWEKMSPEALATLCQWVADVILAERPDAVIGPNLRGWARTYGFDARFIKAGGLDRMAMVVLRPQPGFGERPWLRKYRVWLRETSGRELPVYVIGYGASDAQSEREQAADAVRQTLAFYADGATVAIPGTGDIVGSDGGPRPLLPALATFAEMIGGARFLGDLDPGEGVEAMLFEEKGVHTLALWSADEESMPVRLQPRSDTFSQTGLMGAETGIQQAAQADWTIVAGPDVVYLRGVGAELAAEVVPAPSTGSRRGEQGPRWSRTASKLAPEPSFDGSFESWAGASRFALLDPEIHPADASGTVYLGWDEGHLYIGLDMRDNEVRNRQPLTKLFREDSLELFLSTALDTKAGEFGTQDHQYWVAPASEHGERVVVELDPSKGEVSDRPEFRRYIGETETGWVAQVALPWSAFPEFDARSGARLRFDFRVNDADATHERWKVSPDNIEVQYDNPAAWPVLHLR
ncbi:MAG: DUF4886 domain-containing protein [Kiritimatiellae bacterium]|jgi:hypothetical protein|nr:DUF4886 domain-containing protein [Kiritimatiellia bacterium]